LSAALDARDSRLGSPTQRTSGGYRIFPASAVQRVQLAQRALQLGFSLKELSEFCVLVITVAHLAIMCSMKLTRTWKLFAGLLVATAAVAAPAQTIISFDDPHAGTASGQGTVAGSVFHGNLLTPGDSQKPGVAGDYPHAGTAGAECGGVHQAS